MFGISDYPTFVGAVIIFLAIPGPGNLALLTSTAQAGLRGGLVAALGIMAGDQVLMWAAVAGLSALLLASPMWFGVIQWLGALYLAYLGVRMVTAKPGDAPLLDMSSGRFFRQSFFITLLNPKAIVFYMAFFRCLSTASNRPRCGPLPSWPSPSPHSLFCTAWCSPCWPAVCAAACSGIRGSGRGCKNSLAWSWSALACVSFFRSKQT